MFEFPKLISDLRKNNFLDYKEILNSKIPWLKLNIDGPNFTDDILSSAVKQSSNWREQWKMVETNYQVRDWNGSVLFGPSDWDKWNKVVKADNLKNDEDHLCMIHRKNMEFSWRIDEFHPVRLWIENIFPNVNDINIVNYYVLPPGGYLFPHIDPCESNKALNKIYIPLRWKEGCEFGFYKWGNMPVVENQVYLINNYAHAHWVLNDSNEDRIVLDIGANLESIADIIIESFLSH